VPAIVVLHANRDTLEILEWLKDVPGAAQCAIVGVNVADYLARDDDGRVRSSNKWLGRSLLPSLHAVDLAIEFVSGHRIVDTEAIYVAAGESGAQRLDALTLLLGWVQRLESDGEMLCHALGDYRRTETDNLTDVGVALAGFLSTKASVAQHFDLFESAADRGDRPSSMADVKNAFRELADLRADLDRLAGLRRRLEPIGTRLRCRFTKSQPLPPPRLAIDVQLDRAIQTAGWLKRVATAYSIYDASPADKE